MTANEIRFLLVLFLAALISCSYNENKVSQPADSQLKILETPEQISYQMVSDQVFSGRCISCHSASGGNKGDVNLESYSAVKLWLKEIREEVSTKAMPPKRSEIGLSLSETSLVIAWIDAGAVENPNQQPATTTDPVITPPTTTEPVIIPSVVIEPEFIMPKDSNEITFAMVKKVLLAPQCFKCHSDATVNKGDINLETYKNVSENIQDMYDDISNGDMPRGKEAKLTDLQLKIFFDWFDAGHEENGKTVKLDEKSSETK
ncbi:MAG: hypothetical protein WA160_05060 [Pseudobdellovibrio sp.]